MPEHKMKAQSRDDRIKAPPLSGRPSDLVTLTEQEETILKAVLQKEDLEMRIVQAKISELRKEIQEIRKAGALSNGENQNAICARCKAKFSLVLLPWSGRGQQCSTCKFRVCSGCCMKQPNGSWLCILCFKYRQEKLLTGEWFSAGSSTGPQGSELVKAMIEKKRRVPHIFEEERGINFTQRPAKARDVDCESRTSRNSQSSTEHTDSKGKQKISTSENAEVKKETKQIGNDDKGQLPIKERRDSYFQALENQKATVSHQKGNNTGNLHWWQKVQQPKHASSEVEPLGQTMEAWSSVVFPSSPFTDENLQRENNTSWNSRKTKDMPAVLPSQFQFRNSSVSQSQTSEKGSHIDSLKEEQAGQTKKSKPATQFLLLSPGKSSPGDENTMANSDASPSSEKNSSGTMTLTGGKKTKKTSRTTRGDNFQKKDDKKGGNFEEFYNSNVNRLVKMMTGDRSGEMKESSSSNSGNAAEKGKGNFIQSSLSVSKDMSENSEKINSTELKVEGEQSEIKARAVRHTVVPEKLLLPSEIMKNNPFETKEAAACTASRLAARLATSNLIFRKRTPISKENIQPKLIFSKTPVQYQDELSSDMTNVADNFDMKIVDQIKKLDPEEIAKSVTSGFPEGDNNPKLKDLPKIMEQSGDGSRSRSENYLKLHLMRSGSDVSDTLSIVTERPEPVDSAGHFQFHFDPESDDTFEDTRFEESLSYDNDVTTDLTSSVIIFEKPQESMGGDAQSDEDFHDTGSEWETSSLNNYFELSFDNQENVINVVENKIINEANNIDKAENTNKEMDINEVEGIKEPKNINEANHICKTEYKNKVDHINKFESELTIKVKDINEDECTKEHKDIDFIEYINKIDFITKTEYKRKTMIIDKSVVTTEAEDKNEIDAVRKPQDVNDVEDKNEFNEINEVEDINAVDHITKTEDKNKVEHLHEIELTNKAKNINETDHIIKSVYINKSHLIQETTHKIASSYPIIEEDSNTGGFILELKPSSCNNTSIPTLIKDLVCQSSSKENLEPPKHAKTTEEESNAFVPRTSSENTGNSLEEAAKHAWKDSLKYDKNIVNKVDKITFTTSSIIASAGKEKPEVKPTLLSLAKNYKEIRSVCPGEKVYTALIPKTDVDPTIEDWDVSQKSDPTSGESGVGRSPRTDHAKDTDSGITSGSTTRTNTPEQRSPPYRSISDPSQIPKIAVASMGAESFQEKDDDLDELFHNRYPNQLLGSRSSLADSRESIYSCYSDAGEVNYGKIPVTGEIMFNISYDAKNRVLEVHVKQCRDLAPVDTKHNRSDPYVKTYLLPDKTRGSKRKTKIKKHTLNPVFDEVLKYQIGSGELETRTLWLTVWHNDRLGRNDFLGEVTISLDYYRFDQNTPMWYPLQERVVTQEPVMFYKGDLLIALKYVPADMVERKPKKRSSFRRKDRTKESHQGILGEVHVLVREAHNLTAMRSSAGSNPFCKGYLLPDVSHASKQKTPVIKKTTNPQWQHIMVFENVDESRLHESGLELTIWDHEKLSSNDFLGGVRLNLGQGSHQGSPVDWMDARGEEIEAWQSMIERPNEWIDAQLPLRATMGNQNVKK